MTDHTAREVAARAIHERYCKSPETCDGPQAADYGNAEAMLDAIGYENTAAWRDVAVRLANIFSQGSWDSRERWIAIEDVRRLDRTWADRRQAKEVGK